MSQIEISKLIAPVYYEEHKAIKDNQYTYFWNEGGRGSAKSSFNSIEIALELKRDKNAHAAIFMKVADNMDTKVAEQMTWAFDKLNLLKEWRLTKKPLRYTNRKTGQKIFFSGCDDPTKSKGIKVSKGVIKIVWFEEVDQFDNWKEIRTVLQSLFRKNEAGETPKFKVFTSYNPPREPNNWVNKCSKEKWEDRFVLHTSYLDIPKQWLTDEFVAEAERLKQVDEKAYQHEYLGFATGRDGLVYPMFNPDKHVINDFEAGELITMVVIGSDGGNVRDATTLVPLCVTTHGRIVVLPTMYYDPLIPGHRPLATVDQVEIAERWIYEKICLKYGISTENIMINVDSAASDLFLEFQRRGHFETSKVDKKDVMVDMRRLQSVLSYEGLFAIINEGYLDPLTNEMLGENDMLIEEFQSKVINEKNGKPEDGNDHCLDACKYGTRKLQLLGVI